MLALILDTFPTLSEAFLYSTIANLERAGMRVRVLARKRGSQALGAPFKARVRYLPAEDTPWLVKAPLLLFYALRLLMSSPALFRRAAGHFLSMPGGWRGRALQAYRCLPILCQPGDVIYLSFGGLAVKYLPLFSLKERVCFSLRGSDINIAPLVDPSYAASLAQAARQAWRVHCVSEDTKRRAVELSGENASKFHVIYTALNPVFLQECPPRVPADILRLVSVGRLDWRKGLEHGLATAQVLKQRGIPFEWRIIGEGPYRTALQWAVRDMGLEQQVTLEGARGQAEIREVLCAAEVCFHPSVAEGISNSVLEGMACGLPVVCCDVGGMREALTDGVEGFLTATRDWPGMADRLALLAADSHLRGRMGAAGRARVLAQFNTARQMEGWRAFLDSGGVA